jgi:hypothetical protein
MPGEGLTHGPPAEKKAGGSHHRFSRTSGIPCAVVLTLIRDLPGDRLIAPVCDDALSPARCTDLSTGRSGPHDFTSESQAVRLTAATRPPLTHLTYRDDRPKRPSCRGGLAMRKPQFPKKRKRNILTRTAGQ